jgi:hypothetical protein
VAEHVIPSLKEELSDIMSTRVARRSVEQKLVQFELTKRRAMRNGCYVCSVSSPPNPAIETVVRTHSEAEAIG